MDIKDRLKKDMTEFGIDSTILDTPEEAPIDVPMEEEVPTMNLMDSVEEIKPMLAIATAAEVLAFLKAVV